MRPAYSGLRQRPRDPITGRIVVAVDAVVLGRKFCVRCGRWRPVCDFGLDRHLASGLRSYCAACFRTHQRESYHQAQLSPKRHLDRIEYYRFWREAKAREEGRPFVSTGRVLGRGIEPEDLDAEPLIPLLREAEVSRLARTSGIDERTIARIRNRHQRKVHLDTADRLAVALGIPLGLLYNQLPKAS